MTDTTTHNTLKKERFPLTTGTVIFVFTVFLLVAGFCRFSFYVLKNHRSAVARDTFIQSYVDVQPYAGPRPAEDASYVRLADTGLATVSPAVFFREEPKEEAPVEKTAALRPLTVPVPDFRRPPVVRNPEKRPETEIRPNEAEEDPSDADSTPVPLEFLISSAEDTLNEADETVLKSEPILSEPRETLAAAQPVAPETITVAAARPVAPETITVAAQPVAPETITTAATQPAAPETIKVAATETAAPRPAEKTVGKRENREHWIDIAALRERIKAEKDEQAAANAAFAAANASVKADASATETDGASAPAPAPTVRNDVPPAPQQTAQETPVSTAAVPAAPAEQPLKRESAQTQTAQTQIQTQPPAAPKPSNPWLVSKVAGKAHNSLAVHDYRVTEKPKAPEKQAVKNEKTLKEPPVLTALSDTAAEKRPEKSGEPVFYRNGRKKTLVTKEREPEPPVAALPVEDRNLNWLDRKQAAVWTSLSQTDAPSVWNERSSEKREVRAFRVADEIPADGEPVENAAAPASAEGAKPVSSKPVITVGEDKKPEAKKDPLLLPLGAPEESKISANSVPKGAPVPIAAFPIDGQAKPAEPAAAAPATAVTGGEGLIDKMKSLFSIGDSSPSPTPDLGNKTASAAPEERKAVPAAAEAAPQTFQASPVFIPAAAQNDKANVLPAEIRLTFKPDSAEMSAQAVKWVKAFGMRVKKDIQHAIEVRMSSENFPLQEKRFALIRSTLIGVGVQDTQILPVVSDRTPHTIVLKTLDIPEEGLSSYETSVNGVTEKMYYRRW